MADVTISPNMNLPVPSVGVDFGPDWANNLNASLSIIDQHNHSSGSGVQITPNGLNINSDLSFISNNAINIRSSRYTPQLSVLSGASDLGCVYVSGADLYYNDTSGNQVRITSGGSVNATSSGISSGSATASFVASVLVVNAASNTPANIQVASILLGNNISGSNYLTLSPPSAMGSNFSLILPNVPASTSFLQIDNSGNISGAIPVSGGITASNLAPSIANSFVPSGAILAYGGALSPAGFLICDGSSYLRSAQPNLFTAIGTAYGSADGTHFNVPDLRGLFQRGVDGGSGNDPNAASRTAANPGGNTGNNVGSSQADIFGAHEHSIPVNTGSGSSQIVASTATSLYNGGANLQTLAAGGSETRPKNLYVNYIIKT